MSGSRRTRRSAARSAAFRLVLSGELTIQTAGERRAELVEALERAEQSSAPAVELDLAGITELDTAGLQLLLVAQREAVQLGRGLRLSAMSQTVSDVLAIAHLNADLDARAASVAANRRADAEEMP